MLLAQSKWLTCHVLLLLLLLQLEGPSQLGRRGDMDPNGHINNVAYLSWALEVIPQHVYDGYHLTQVCLPLLSCQLVANGPFPHIQQFAACAAPGRSALALNGLSCRKGVC
eukprot:GHRR01034791.1.p1 GENE.GHRR01034791.1~~GHRR01034791.1.p1  ORF type:complete len:111 (-),score=13.79 GHRR01034791.1:331-663(-)